NGASVQAVSAAGKAPTALPVRSPPRRPPRRVVNAMRWPPNGAPVQAASAAGKAPTALPVRSPPRRPPPYGGQRHALATGRSLGATRSGGGKEACRPTSPSAGPATAGLPGG